MLVAVNDFVRRQVENSGKTFAKTLSFDQIANHASAQMQNIKAISIDASASSLTLYIVDENKLKKVTKY